MLRWTAQVVLWWVVAQVALIVLFAFVNPPTNFYMASESWRLNGIKQDWVPIEQIAGDMARAVVAAEDADFCQHWGFDLAAIRAVVKSRSTHARCVDNFPASRQECFSVAQPQLDSQIF
jgi:monofunctional glycosyltransferase